MVHNSNWLRGERPMSLPRIHQHGRLAAVVVEGSLGWISSRRTLWMLLRQRKTLVLVPLSNIIRRLRESGIVVRRSRQFSRQYHALERADHR